MANLIRQQNLIDSNKRALLKYILISDGTQSANSVLLDASMLKFALNANGYIMTGNTHTKSNYRTSVKRVFGSATLGSGAYLKLQWQGDSNSEIVTIGTGNFDYSFDSVGDNAVITNPEANATGDILITTNNLTANDVATIFLDVRKNSEDYDAGQTADPASFNKGDWRLI